MIALGFNHIHLKFSESASDLDKLNSCIIYRNNTSVPLPFYGIIVMHITFTVTSLTTLLESLLSVGIFSICNTFALIYVLCAITSTCNMHVLHFYML